jgi:hypothetical protein
MGDLFRAAIVVACLLWPTSALADPAVASPDLDCSGGFDGIRSAALTLPGARAGQEGRYDLVAAEMPDTWKVEYAFTRPGQAAHPAVTLRTFKKQVTGVWTAQSKGCSFGDLRQFAALMADMKQRDKELTDASRAEVEGKKQEQSPLGPTP